MGAPSRRVLQHLLASLDESSSHDNSRKLSVPSELMRTTTTTTPSRNVLWRVPDGDERSDNDDNEFDDPPVNIELQRHLSNVVHSHRRVKLWAIVRTGPVIGIPSGVHDASVREQSVSLWPSSGDSMQPVKICTT
jgi:hypothetical protein